MYIQSHRKPENLFSILINYFQCSFQLQVYKFLIIFIIFFVCFFLLGWDCSAQTYILEFFVYKFSQHIESSILNIMNQGGYQKICQLNKVTTLYKKLEGGQLTFKIITKQKSYQKKYHYQFVSLAQFPPLEKKCNKNLQNFFKMLKNPDNLKFQPPNLFVSDPLIQGLCYLAKMKFSDCQEQKLESIKKAKKILNSSRKGNEQFENFIGPLISLIKSNWQQLRKFYFQDDELDQAPVIQENNNQLRERKQYLNFLPLNMKNILQDEDQNDPGLLIETNTITNKSARRKIYFKQILTKKYSYSFKFSLINTNVCLGIAKQAEKRNNIYFRSNGQFSANFITNRKKDQQIKGFKVGQQVILIIDIQLCKIKWEVVNKNYFTEENQSIKEGNWVVFIELDSNDKVQVGKLE